jgi:hypothetical protein
MNRTTFASRAPGVLSLGTIRDVAASRSAA